MLDAACLSIVGLYVALRVPRGADARAWLARFVSLAAVSWLGEASMVMAYGFYEYDARWAVFVGPVPLAVPLIWPVVVLSALDLVEAWAPSSRRPAVWVAALVFTDAALIEPIAVASGLWHWTRAGVFDVPPIGLLGWAVYAGGVSWVVNRRSRASWSWFALAELLGALAATHAIVVSLHAATFGALARQIPTWASVSVAALLAFTGALEASRVAPKAVLVRAVMLRAPGAAFFLSLLLLEHRDAPALLAYAGCFVAPYLVLLARAGRAPRAASATVAPGTGGG